MKSAMTTGTALAALLLTTAACGGTSSSSGGSGSGPKAASITIVANSLPSGLDPDSTVSTDSGIQQVVTTNYAGPLFSVNGVKSNPGSTPQVAPDLAASASASPDGLTWTIKLRPDAKSSANNPLTADDVVWTFKRVLNAKVNGASLLGQINIDPANPVTAVDKNTVALHLTAPSAIVEQILALPSLGIIDSVEAKKHVTADDPYATKWLNANSASFGPYQVKSITAQKEVVLVDNPHYWKGAPQITRATYKTVQDASTTLQTALTGQSDYTIGLPPTDLKTLEKSKAVVVHKLPVPTVLYLTLDQKNPALTDVRVRRAVSYAIDRTAIDKTVYNGDAPPTTGCLPASLLKTTTPLDNAASPEVQKAKDLLAQVPGAKTFTIGTLPSVFPESATIARIIQSNLNEAGIKTTIKTYSAFGPIVADIKAHRISGFILKQAPYVPDAGYFFKAFFLGTSLFNFSSYANPTFDAAANASMRESADTRQSSLDTACNEFLTDAPAAMLVEAGNISVGKKTITNVQDLTDTAPRLYNLRVTG